MNRGVIILAMRKQQYAAASFNLALSIRHHSLDIHITLLSDGIHRSVFSAEHYAQFNSIKQIEETSVCEAKLNVHKYSDNKHSLYIDADSLCLRPIEPIFHHLKGNDFKSNCLDPYTAWTSDENFLKFFFTPKTQTINSSWIYFENNAVFEAANLFYQKGFNREDLNEKWGGQLPDELFFNGAISSTGTDAKTDIDLMFFDEKKGTNSAGKLPHYFITFYGNKGNTRLEFREWYDKEMFRICESFGMEHRFKMPEIMAHKLVNER